MIIKRLELQNYRNYNYEFFDFEPGINVLYGNNAQGKTNALESIFFCATGKTHRKAKEKEIINFSEQEAHIKLSFNRRDVDHYEDIHLRSRGKKSIVVDGTSLRRTIDILGNINVIIFAPEDLLIIKSSPSERRNFINTELCQLDKSYTYNLVNYNKVLDQKNKLLKQIDYNGELLDTLPVWNEQLIKYGTEIIKKRKEFISEIEEILIEKHSSLTDNSEKIKMIYQPNSSEEAFSDCLNSGIKREIAAGMSLFGPHRDDIMFTINDVLVKSFASQGQQRTVALSLKLAEIEYVKRKIGDMPVLLLDDVLSELDGGRQRRLLTELNGIQTIITCTGLDEFIDNSFEIDKVFYIDEGKVTEVKL